MERSYPSFEFEAEVLPDGTIKVPGPLARTLGGGKRVVLRLTDGVVSMKLRRRNVTEEEVERIALTQLEQRDSVIHFLESEGALSKPGAFAKRAQRFGMLKR